MAEKETHQQKWKGTCSIELKRSSANKVWSLLFEDFCNVQKWLPVDMCSYVEGVAGKPGLIRRCISKAPSSTDGQDVLTTKWIVDEKLKMIDPIKRCLSYEITDNNIGFKSYVGTWELFPINGENDGAKAGCKFQWTFDSDPVEGWTFEELQSFVQNCLKFMANKMEDA